MNRRFVKTLFVIGFLLNSWQALALQQNPLNNIKSGSFVFDRVDTKTAKITQTALDTQVNMEINGVVNRVKIKQSFVNNNDI